jgi:putative PIN family toxin of toxin-antitoxin system
MDDVFITDYSLKEISDKLLNKYGNTKQNWWKIINCIDDLIFIHKFKLLLTHDVINECKTRDYKDDKILNCAIQNNMDLLITGDKDLLTFKTNKICITKFSEWVNMRNKLFS